MKKYIKNKKGLNLEIVDSLFSFINNYFTKPNTNISIKGGVNAKP